MSVEKVRLSLYDLLLVFIAFIGLSNVFLLAAKVFTTSLSLLFASIATALTLAIFRPKINSKFQFSRTNLFIFAILVVGLIFRVPPYLYLAGGQDQGTYVNISKQYELSRSLYAVDHFRETLTEKQKMLYDEHGNYMMPSIEKWNRPDSEYTMKFYPLHPSFMANFGQLFGSDNRIYSLTLFSLITMINIYLIVKKLSKSQTAGLIALLLISLNPLHVFFSKMPVGEITALAFASAGFYFLIRFFICLKDMPSITSIYIRFITNPIFMYLSSLMFFTFMFARMTFIIYLTLFFIALCGSILFLENRRVKMYLLSYFLILSSLMVLSYLYYFKFIGPLFDLIFKSTITRNLRNILFFVNLNNSERIVFIAVTCAIIVIGCYFIRNRFTNKINKSQKAFLQVLLAFTLAVVIFTLILNISRFINLGFTGIELYERWGISKQGFNSAKYSVFFSIINHISIFGFLLYLSYFVYAFIKKGFNYITYGTFLVFSYFFVLYSILLDYMRYDYYNSRYYLTEIIPTFIVFVSIYVGNLIQSKTGLVRFWTYLSVAAISVYYFFFSAIQFFGSEGLDRNFYTNLFYGTNNYTLFVLLNKPDDIKYKSNFNNYVFAPVKYYFDKKTMILSTEDTLNSQEFVDLAKIVDRVLIVSNVSINETVLSSYKFSLKKIGDLELTYKHYNNSVGCGFHNYEFLNISTVKEFQIPSALKCGTLPTAYFTRNKMYSLYELDL